MAGWGRGGEELGFSRGHDTPPALEVLEVLEVMKILEVLEILEVLRSWSSWRYRRS